MIGNRALTLLTNILYFTSITDMETGYKVFKSSVIKNLKLSANRFEIEPEITSKIMKGKYQIYEVPISFKPRDFKEGKKISWKDGMKALYYIIKYKFQE